MGNSFSALFDRWAWRPIPNCPGRYVLAAGPSATPPEDLVPGANGSEHTSGSARDPVIVTPFEDGGLISYRQADGRFLHTLNTREGFERKLRQLGIR
jgi:phage baseplate assembly protein gpV